MGVWKITLITKVFGNDLEIVLKLLLHIILLNILRKKLNKKVSRI